MSAKQDDMPRGEIVIEMIKKDDEYGNTYMFANPDLPVSVPLDKCFFIAFTANKPCLIIRRRDNQPVKRMRTRSED